MTNYEKIKSMDIKKMAKFISYQGCATCCFDKMGCNGMDCYTGRVAWLLQEAEE